MGRKAAFAAKSQKNKIELEEKAKSKKIVGQKSKPVSGSKSSGKASSTLQDEDKKDDEDKESIVEKDQIEEMETCPVDDLEAGKDYAKDNEDDEDDLELQRIKDDDEEAEENHVPVPDIAEKMDNVEKETKKEQNQKNIPENLVLEKEKVSYSHIKTPDEVDDLPEHEAVIPDSHVMEEIKSEISGDLEEKIALDESEKESSACKKEGMLEKSEGS